MEVDSSYWLNKYDANCLPWHHLDINDGLVEYFDKCVESKSKLFRTFVPLCGKTLDLKWLADKGCDVIGVELSKLAIEAFFIEQSLTFTTFETSDKNITLYKCDSLPISIYLADIFLIQCLELEKFDFIWDRGCLVALNPSDRNKYVNLIKSLAKDGTNYLIETYVYDENEYQGTPHSVPFSLIKELYENSFKCYQIKEVECLKVGQEKFSGTLSNFFKNYVRLVSK